MIHEDEVRVIRALEKIAMSLDTLARTAIESKTILAMADAREVTHPKGVDKHEH